MSEIHKPILPTTEIVTLTGTPLDVVRIRIGDAIRHMESTADSFVRGGPGLPTMVAILQGHARFLAQVLVYYLGESRERPPKDDGVEYTEATTPRVSE